MIVKCLSIRQPHANAILTGQKAHEFRTWRTDYRGPLAVHAGMTLDRAALAEAVYPNFTDGKRLKRGVVLGLVDVVDCQEMWDDHGPIWGWLLARPRWLREPLPLKGRLGLFDVEIAEANILPAGR